MKHIATLYAYKIKAESGGGYRGVIYNRDTEDMQKSERYETLDAAAYWVKAKAHELFTDIGYRLAPIYMKGEYRANVWVD